MANNVMHYTRYLMVLIVCIDLGDGLWRKKDKQENLHQDIEVFRKIADKVEQEIEDFYDEFPEERLKEDNVDLINYKYAQNTMRRDSLIRNVSEVNVANPLPNSISDISTNSILPTNFTQHIITNVVQPYNRVSFRDAKSDYSDEQKFNYKWPKFEDILFEIGKRYDWKNDRWIKVRQKNKEISSKNVKVKTYVNLHEKHKFSYRIVKLNRNKSRRNVVVAVSAVR